MYSTFEKIGKISESNNNNNVVKKVIEVKNQSQLLSVIKEYTIIKYYTDWCTPCQHISPKFSELANEFMYDNWKDRIIVCPSVEALKPLLS